MSKKINLNATTKLSNLHKNKEEHIGIMVSKKTTKHPKAFRFTQTDIGNLNKLKAEVNRETMSEISEPQILRALIHIGAYKLTVDDILVALREML